MKTLCLVGVAVVLGCAGATPEIPVPDEPPNILWIVTEDISPALGCYGDGFATTPNLDRLARESILYRNAFATAPICSPSRSCLITGLYATALGTQHLRCEVRLPSSLKPFPHYLRGRGYFCTNRNKTDYNFDPAGIWDHRSSSTTPWREAKAGRPFFSMINFGTTHEGPTNFEDRYRRSTKDLPPKLRHDPAKAIVPPFYPDTPEIRKIFARLADLITAMDREVGDVLARLKEDGLDEDTIVFFFSDHGHGLPRYKRWLNDSGLRVPLIVRVPKKYRGLVEDGPGEATDRMVSFVDFAPTVMSLAGLQVPGHMQGVPFMGRWAGPPRRYVYGARSRADDMFECSRAVHDGRYIYVRHFLPHLPYIQPGFIYGDQKRSYRELRRLHREGRLEGPAAALWAPRKPLEELYDLREDPHELTNLAGSSAH